MVIPDDQGRSSDNLGSWRALVRLRQAMLLGVVVMVVGAVLQDARSSVMRMAGATLILAGGAATVVAAYLYGWKPCPVCGRPFGTRPDMSRLDLGLWFTGRCQYCATKVGQSVDTVHWSERDLVSTKGALEGGSLAVREGDDEGQIVRGVLLLGRRYRTLSRAMSTLMVVGAPSLAFAGRYPLLRAVAGVTLGGAALAGLWIVFGLRCPRCHAPAFGNAPLGQAARTCHECGLSFGDLSSRR